MSHDSRLFTLSQNGYGDHIQPNLQHGALSHEEELIIASSTQGCSRTVPQFSTDRALRRLTAEFERDPVYSARYGR